MTSYALRPIFFVKDYMVYYYRIALSIANIVRHKLRGLVKCPYRDQRMLLADIGVVVVLDVGAHVGTTVAKYKKLFPEATIYGFEPFHDSYEKLRSRFSECKLVKPIQAAISNRSGTGQFHAYRNSATNSLLPADNQARQASDRGRCWMEQPSVIEELRTIDVPLITIDDFCERESIDRVDILKMDIQGGELMALEGAREKLRQAAISVIYCEMLFVPLYIGQASFDKVCNYLSSYDYRLFDMYNFTYTKSGRLEWCDAIFIGPMVGL